MPDLKSSQVPSVRVELAPPLENFPRGLQLKLTGQSSNSEIRTTKSLNAAWGPGARRRLDWKLLGTWLSSMATEDSGPLSQDKGHRYQIIAESHRVPVGKRPSGLSVHPPPCWVRPLSAGGSRDMPEATQVVRWGCQDPVPALQRQKLLPRFATGGLESHGNRSPGGEWAHPSCSPLKTSGPISLSAQHPRLPLNAASRRDRRKVSPLPGELAAVLATWTFSSSLAREPRGRPGLVTGSGRGQSKPFERCSDSYRLVIRASESSVQKRRE